MKLICRTSLSAFLRLAQCCDVSVHCEMPRKDNKSLKVSMSLMGFFQKSSLISCGQTDMGQQPPGRGKRAGTDKTLHSPLHGL